MNPTGNKHIEGMFRVCAAVPTVTVGNPKANADSIINLAYQADNKGAQLIVMPELSVSAYTCGDLFRESLLLDSVEKSISKISAESLHMNAMLVVGAPIRYSDSLYNCAVFIQKGEIQAVVPKCYIPNYNEFYEKRRFASGADIIGKEISIAGQTNVPFGVDILLKSGDVTVATDVCEDLWVPVPPSCMAALAGANVIVNLSATDELTGKHSYLLQLIKSQSARLRSAYVYSSAGFGESSTDLVFAGNGIIAENGVILESTPRFTAKPQMAIADVDVQMLDNDRRNHSSFADNADKFNSKSDYRVIESTFANTTVSKGSNALYRKVNPHPFVPAGAQDLDQRCEEIVSIQAAGLMQRLSFTHCKSLVVGISGGLDSTLALLIAVKAFENLGLDLKGIYGITMPGFGTTVRTRTNADTIMEQLGITPVCIPIADAVNVHFSDIEHDPKNHDVTYENSQARERTQILMDYANRVGGMVLGTGDLSELALGWCTYNGDHMSMYAVNSSVPKTLVKHLVSWFASKTDNEPLAKALIDIVNTPISPELIPFDSEGNIAQKTESLVGPYELHDFFLYQLLRHSFAPDKIYMLARIAFDGKYDGKTIKFWLREFYRRFFSQQFKRSCMPDGPKVGSATLSPRGDWRMPSDASSAIWLECIDNIDCE